MKSPRAQQYVAVALVLSFDIRPSMKRTFIISLLYIVSLNAGAESFSLDLLKNLKVVSEKNDKIDIPKKTSVIVFLSSICPCSDSHVPEISRLAKEFPEFPFYIIHSNQDEDKVTSQKYFAEKKLSIPVLIDSNASIAKLLDAYKTPHSYVIDSEGKILYQGGVTDSSKLYDAKKFYLQQSLEELKQGKSVSMPVTRTLGCTIDRGEKNVW